MKDLIIQCDLLLSRSQMHSLREEIKRQAEEGIVLLPPGVHIEKSCAKWIQTDYYNEYECEICKHRISIWSENEDPEAQYHYCPGCGAKMF